MPRPNKTPAIPTAIPSIKVNLAPIKKTAGNTKIIPEATDSPPEDIPCSKFLPKIPRFLATAAIIPEPRIAPGIPAATVSPDFMPE